MSNPRPTSPWLTGCALTALVFAACSSNPSPRPPTTAGTLDACSLVSQQSIQHQIGKVAKVRPLGPDDFKSPPPSDLKACSFVTSTRYGQVIVFAHPTTAAAFRAQYSGKGTSKVVRPVPNLGDEAYFDCGQVSARSGDTAVIVGVQKADCHLEMRLAALVREGLAGLPTSSPAG